MPQLQLPSSTTIEHAAALVRQVEEAVARLARGETLTIDAAALRGFDTSLVAVLLHARRLSQRAGAGFGIQGAPEKLCKLARLYGVDDLLLLDAGAGATAASG